MGKLLYDGVFPFCVPEVDEDEVGPGTDYPVGIPFEMMVRWYWVQKSWVIEADAGASFTGPGGSVDVVFTEDDEEGRAMTVNKDRQMDLVCWSDGLFQRGEEKGESSSFGPAAEASAAYFLEFFYGGRPAVRVGGMYYPACRVYVRVRAIGSDGPPPISGESEKVLDTSVDGGGAVVTVTVDGVDFNVRISEVDSGAGAVTTLDAVRIIPAAEWP